jgi:phosphoglycolate phosphatase
VGDLRRLIAFDLDGTLIDSRRDLTDAANALIVELGGTPLTEEAIGEMVGDGARLLVQRALAAARIGDVPGALRRFLVLYDERLLNFTRLYPGIDAVVHAAQRHARLAVLTNKPAEPSERILAALRVREYFADVIGGDGAWPRKPDPASLRELMTRAGASPARTLLIGDSPIDYETARRAGVRCCIAAYGFGAGRFRRDQLLAEDWIVDEPAALEEAIQRFLNGSS